MLLPLPPALVRIILALLPPDARARAACVNRAWRAAADAPDLWTTLDMRPFATLGADKYAALLRGAAAKARGRLVSLDARAIPGVLQAVVQAALRPVVAANSGTLHELWVGSPLWARLFINDVTAFLTSAPALRALHADVRADPEDAAALLSEPRLRMRKLDIAFSRPMASLAPLAALLPLLRRCTALRRLLVEYLEVDDAAPLRELLDAAAAARVPALELADCNLSADAPTALAALLRSGTLARLEVTAPDNPLLRNARAAAPLCDALRGCANLTLLCLCGVALFDDIDAGVELLAAVTGHVSIRRLYLPRNAFEDNDDGGNADSGALAALLAADAPSLTDLSLCGTVTSDRAAAPLLRALRANTHLRGLDLGENKFSAVFVDGELLSALRANASLEWLRLDRSRAEQRAAAEFVAHRAAATSRRGAAALFQEAETDDEW